MTDTDTLILLQLDLPAFTVALLAALLCAAIGNHLVLRGQAMLSDAVSHAVLPGIVVGWIVTGTRSLGPMLAGALIAAACVPLLTQAARRFGGVEEGAGLGAVFTLLFAAGLLLIEQSGAHAVDLDLNCVLYGALEGVTWTAATGWGALLDRAALAELPRELITLAGLGVVVALLLTLFHKELRLTAFDPGLAAALGFRPGVMALGVTVFAALVAVASFEAVGSILVVALMVCPPAAARLVTDRYGTQMGLSLGFAALSVALGYPLGAALNVSISGMVALVSGALLGAAVLQGRHGLARGRAPVDQTALTPP